MNLERVSDRTGYSQEAKYRLLTYEFFVSVIGFFLTCSTILMYSVVSSGASAIWLGFPVIATLIVGSVFIYIFVQYGVDDEMTQDDKNAKYILPLPIFIVMYAFYIGQLIPMTQQSIYFTLSTVATIGLLGWFSGILVGLSQKWSTLRSIGIGFGYMCLSTVVYAGGLLVL